MSDTDDATRLRNRVLDELALVQGRIALAAKLDGRAAKEQLRLAHSTQREARLSDAAEFLIANEEALLEHFADGRDVDPAGIDPYIVPVRTPIEADLFRYATLQWSVPVSSGYGRRSRFLVWDRQNDKLIAIFALGDPVIAQQARDRFIGWDTEQRNRRLYNVYDAFVLGAVEPYRQLLGGKLVALLTLADETLNFLSRKYHGNTTEIRGEVKDPTPLLITTSSALGRSSIYNRLTYRGSLKFHSVGFTRGFGHFQFSNDLFNTLRLYVKEHAAANEADAAMDQSSQYGKGPNWRFRVIRNALELLGIDEDHLQHNVRREVFLAPTAANWDKYLRGETDKIESYEMSAKDIGAYYRERWAIGRAERMPAFRYWRKDDERLLPRLQGRPVQFSLSSASGPPAGRVSMGHFDLAVGTGRREIRGDTLAGVRTSGSAVLSVLDGPDISITLAQIDWANGEREVRGWDRGSSNPAFDDVIGRLRIGIHPAERYRSMATMEIRPSVARQGRHASAGITSTEKLADLLGLDLVSTIDGIGGATVGRRSDLLRDSGPRRNQLCVVFQDQDLTIPALVWSLIRPIALALQLDPGSPRPSAPEVKRAAPRNDDLIQATDY